MVDKDIVVAKIAIIQRCLKRIKDVTGLETNSLDDIDTQDIFVLNLQRAIQAAIDIAAHIISSESWKIPDTFKEYFKILAQKKILDSGLSNRLQNMVGFRNIAIHDYQNLDTDILKSILEKHLIDLEKYYLQIIGTHQLDDDTNLDEE